MSESTDPSRTETASAFANPRVGDRFHEMLSFWMYVVSCCPCGRIATMELGYGTFPDDATLRWFDSHAAYRAHYSYNTMPGRYWVRLAGRDHDVTGWLESKTNDLTPTPSGD